MFRFENHVYKSDFLSSPGVGHAFSVREGGVSRQPHTKSMNLSFGLGDEDSEVIENMRLLCSYAGVSFGGLIGSPQHHTDFVRYVTSDNAGEGVTRENFSHSDGFATDHRGVSVIIRMADCTPILFLGNKGGDVLAPIVAAVHAGWKGTVAGIAANAVYEMKKLGADPADIKVAIGQCIHKCHFEVQDDFVENITKAAGADFAARHIEKTAGGLYADIVGMNLEFLLSSGVKKENIDISPFCTACDGAEFHSHRASHGKRGTMGAVIGIVRERKD